MFDVLAHLLGAGGRVVSKEELLDEVWGDRFVSESALTSRVKTARQVVGDSGTLQRVIRTVHGKGYQFVAEVAECTTDARDSPRAGIHPDRSAPGVISAGRVPLPTQQLIGRAALLDELRAELESCHLITLVGPGGVGKTSVAFELARQVADRYADGVVVVEFVSVVDADATVEALATALDVHTRQHGSLTEAVIDLLLQSEVLLVLDNCEHVVEPIGRIVGQIMRTAPNVRILATSLEPLSVAGERVRPVDPLAVADDSAVPVELLLEVPAIALFVERAKAADPRFELTDANAGAVAAICRRLDGVPLAIELAAARARAIDVTEIASRLDERFRLLKGVRRGSDPRHHTLQDTVRWSYDLLERDEQELFNALSMFAGQFDLTAAEQICGAGDPDDDHRPGHEIDVLDLLTRLTERSMVAVRRPDTGGTRYELFETLRAYGRSRLDDDRAVELLSRHTEYYSRLAVEVGVAMSGPHEPIAMSQASAAFADLRAAQRSALHVGNLDAAFELISSIREYAMRTMRYEALMWADSATVGGRAEDHPLAPMLHGIQAYQAWTRGEFERALTLADLVDSGRGATDLAALGLAERVRGNVLYTQGDMLDGQRATARQIELAEESGHRSRIVHAYYMHSVATSLLDLDEAAGLAAHCCALARESGSPTDVASGFTATGFAAVDDADALAAFAAGDRAAREAGNRWMSAFARTELYGLMLQRGELPAACEGLADVVDVWFRAGEWAQQWHTLGRCVVALSEIDQPERATEAIGAIEGRATMGTPPVMAALRDRVFDTATELRTLLGSDRFFELHAAGAAMPVADVVQRTRAALLGLGTAPVSSPSDAADSVHRGV